MTSSRAFVLVLPWIVAALGGAPACKGRATEEPLAATPTTSASAVAEVSATADIDGAAMIDGVTDASTGLEATAPLASLESIDASDAADASDASEGAHAADALDAPDVLDAPRDAGDDAPLMGAAVFWDEAEARGVRRITSVAGRIHKAPKDHVIVATLEKGTEVALVAQLGDWYRIRFTDPATKLRRQGWVYEINFAGPRRKACPEGWTHHETDGGWCDRECKASRECRAIPGYKCSGTMCFYATP